MKVKLFKLPIKKIKQKGRTGTRLTVTPSSHSDTQAGTTVRLRRVKIPLLKRTEKHKVHPGGGGGRGRAPRALLDGKQHSARAPPPQGPAGAERDAARVLRRPRVPGCADAGTPTLAVLAGGQLVFLSLPDGQGKANSKGANAARARVPFPPDPALPEGSVPICSDCWGSEGLSAPPLPPPQASRPRKALV